MVAIKVALETNKSETASSPDTRDRSLGILSFHHHGSRAAFVSSTPHRSPNSLRGSILLWDPVYDYRRLQFRGKLSLISQSVNQSINQSVSPSISQSKYPPERSRRGKRAHKLACINKRARDDDVRVVNRKCCEVCLKLVRTREFLSTFNEIFRQCLGDKCLPSFTISLVIIKPRIKRDR